MSPDRTGVVVVTGANSGLGSATADLLRGEGRRVIGVDLQNTEVTGDLATARGRSEIIAEVLSLCEGRLDGAVMAAGMGPTPGRDADVAAVNVLGTTELLSGWQAALAQAVTGKVVVVGSNSSTTTPLIPTRSVRKLVAGDVESAMPALRRRRGFSSPATYAASKLAVTQWVRQNAPTAAWAGAGIRLNVVAPGPVLTPMLRSQLEGKHASKVQSFPIPIGHYGNPADVARWIHLLTTPAADYLTGSVITIDGGTEALIRAGNWPNAVRNRSLPRYAYRMLRPGVHALAPRAGQ